MQTVVITGATDGLGFEIAKLYQSQQFVLLGRKPKPELELFQQALYIQADLGQPNAVLDIVRILEQHQIQKLDLLIHNAAMGYYGHLAKQSNQNLSELLQINLYIPIALTKALLNHLQPNGKVVFINSIAAHMAAPDYAVYAASKAALSGFARNLRLEGIKVQSIYPGAIQTSFHEKSGVPKGRFALHRFPSAETTAKQIYRAIQKNKPEVTIGLGNKVARATAYFFPGFFDSLVRSRT